MVTSVNSHPIRIDLTPPIIQVVSGTSHSAVVDFLYTGTVMKITFTHSNQHDGGGLVILHFHRAMCHFR